MTKRLTLSDKQRINEFLDKKALINLNGLKVKVFIDDTKVTYGKQRYLVSPVEGEGQIWVESVEVINEQ